LRTRQWWIDWFLGSICISDLGFLTALTLMMAVEQVSITLVCDIADSLRMLRVRIRQYNLHEKQEGCFVLLLLILFIYFYYSRAKSCIIDCAFCKHIVVTTYTNWIHPKQGALLSMCHFDYLLDPSGRFCAFLILCCLMRGTF
jgi:hypothetical protein